MPFSLLPFHAYDFLEAFEGLLWLSFKETCACQSSVMSRRGRSSCQPSQVRP